MGKLNRQYLCFWLADEGDRSRLKCGALRAASRRSRPIAHGLSGVNLWAH